MSTPSHEVGSLPPPKGDGRQSPAWWQPRRPARQGLQGNSVVGDPHHTGPRWFSERRDALSAEGQNVVAQVGKEPSENPAADHWYKTPIPIIFWGVVTGFIVLVLLGKHRSLCLNLRLRLSHQPCNALLDLLRRRVCDD